MRDGHTSPYIYGPNLGLRSNIVKDALLQRLGCLPVCKAAAVQYLLQLLNEVAPVSGDDGGATPSRTNLRSIANLAGQLRKWLSAGDAEQPGGCPSLQQLVSELQRRVGRDTHGQVVSDELIARTLKMMKKLKTAEPVRAQIDPEDWVTAVERVCVAVRDLHSEFHLGKRAASLTKISWISLSRAPGTCRSTSGMSPISEAAKTASSPGRSYQRESRTRGAAIAAS